MNFLLKLIDRFKHKKSKSIFDDEDILDMFMHPLMPDGSIGRLDINNISTGNIVSGTITTLNMKDDSEE